MITLAIIKLVILLVSLPLSAVDVVAVTILPEGVSEMISLFFGYTYIFNDLIPVYFLYTLIATVLSFEIWVMFYKGGMWLFDTIRQAIRG